MKNIEDKIKYIKFFQDNGYIERSAQINNYQGYDNYLEYYIRERLDPLRYLKIRLKPGKTEDCKALTDTLIEQINPEEYVCVISAFYKDVKMDGYFKRVEQADEKPLKSFKKIYLDHTQLGNRNFSITRYDDEHIIINYNSFNDLHLECISRIIESVRKIYIHSVHVLMPDVFNYQMTDMFFNKNNRTILDLHGAVSEELKQFDSDNRAAIAQVAEEIFMELSDKVVCMSEAMADYYSRKYGIDKNKLIIMSIFPNDNDKDSLSDKKENSTPVVVYAGGIQKWQNIDLIKESVKTNIDRYCFKIFTHDAETLKKQWSDINSSNLIIDSKTNDEVLEEYRNCDFGFLLRDDNIVNNVACPTKMMEYLGHRIIPILKSDKIGNFKEYGLKYLSLEDFNNGTVPDIRQREKMTDKNYKIFTKIVDQSIEGLNQIKDYLK